jgi:hypothetical protein
MRGDRHVRHGRWDAFTEDGDVSSDPLVQSILARLPLELVVSNPVPQETPILLSETFWDARSNLAHIRQAAQSRAVSADVVLHAILARIAGAAKHTIKLPPVVATRASLSYFAAVVGPPDSGKSSPYGVARDLFPVGDHVMDSLPIGSGEGIVEVLFDLVKEPDDDGKLVNVKRQVKYNAIVFIDEGKSLAALSARSGSTLLDTLRSIWSGQTLGQTNASNERKRIVPAGQYSYGLVMGLQPTMAGALLDDVAAGTPQRFSWAWAIDPTIPDTATWPGPLALTLPGPADLEPIEEVPTAGFVTHQVPVARAVADEIRFRRLAIVRGELEVDPHDAHGYLLRLKVAALLSILDERLEVSEDDWDLAEVVTDTSAAVRRHVQSLVAADASQRESATSTKLAARAVVADDATRLNQVDRAAHRIVGVVGRNGGEMLVSHARRNCRSYGDVFDEALDYAIDHGWLTETSEPGQGTDKRILKVVR